MIPYADLLFFGLSLYVLLPAIALGIAGRLTWKWTAIATVFMAAAQVFLATVGDTRVRALRVALVAAFIVWQWAIAFAFLRWRQSNKSGGVWLAVLGVLLPLLTVKFVPDQGLRGALMFLGISYVSFRALDFVLAVHDGLAKELPFAKYATYLFFFPTLSAGPIDRWQRFSKDVEQRPTRDEYLVLLDGAVATFFQGLLYKFVLAVLVRKYWLEPVATGHSIWHTASYMYAYSAYLFFDFAGYSAFAISFSRVLGVRTPPNFNMPFLAMNIADFWARWHISLSTFLRDQIYMRFLLANAKRRWIGSRYVASAVALFLTFGAMGLWHGTAARYLVYGLYHAGIMTAYEWWRRRYKRHGRPEPSVAGRVTATLLTVHAACFGLLIFSGRLF
ncbi:MAG TPA: D-alanyl-lipoteichoic acid biosynthesis protein DltB [Gemmatimonadaceae bacterium]|jgi:membrane protein involved in D-alanine export